MENSVNFALDTVIQHKGTYYRGTGIHDTGHHGIFVVNILYTHTPRLEARPTRFVSRGERRGGARVKSERSGRERERESEARRYLRRIILHYVPKRRTNAVLIYASPRGDKRKAGEIGVSRAGDQLFLKVCAPTRFATGIPRTMLELLRPRISSKGLFSLRFLCARSINNSRFRRSGGVAA